MRLSSSLGLVSKIYITMERIVLTGSAKAWVSMGLSSSKEKLLSMPPPSTGNGQSDQKAWSAFENTIA